jgi:predicted outer membrane repeat protein
MTRVTRRALSTLTALVMVGTLFVGAPSSVRATADDIYIGFNANTSGGSCADPDFTADGSDDSAQIALAVADTNVNGTLHFCPGTYDIDTTIVLDGTDITLQGANATTTILDGGGATRILTSSGAITVSALTFHDGYAAGIGFAGYGGAIFTDTTATVTDSIFTDNAAVEAGAIDAEVSVTVTDSTFTGNTASRYGGAIWSPTGIVTNSTFTGNTASSDGGAIYSGTGTITRSRFTRNTAGEHGGAILLYAPNSDDLRQLRGNTFMRNTAPAGGGAITLGPCTVPSRSEATRVERANRFSGNRATQQRRTNNVERWATGGGCG